MTPDEKPSFTLNRRQLWVAGAGVGAAGLAGAYALGTLTNDQAAPAPSTHFPFYGQHQAGITHEAQPFACFAAFRVITPQRKELQELLRIISSRAGVLTTGFTPAPAGITSPPDDSGTLGPEVPIDRLTVTIGFGASLFDERFGFQAAKPKYLTTMRTFEDDDLQDQWCHGDVLLQIRGDHQDSVLHALRDITRRTRGLMQVQWRQDGFISTPRPTGTPRNHFGFKDGISNPDINRPDTANQLLWAGAEDQPWTQGGTYQVVRLIRMLVEFWDRISMSEQENIFGRNRATGAPLDGNVESDVPDYINDPTGTATPLNSHIRQANPRDDASADSHILRRAYNYSNGMDTNGNLDMGLVFNCYQQNIARQFEATQLRLAGEPLTDYVSPFGGGYFFVPPGLKDPNQYFGHQLYA